MPGHKNTSPAQKVTEELLPLPFRELVHDAHAVEELSGLRLGAPELHHAVRDGHDLREDDVVDAAHGFCALLALHVVPGLFVGDGLQLWVVGRGGSGRAGLCEQGRRIVPRGGRFVVLFDWLLAIFSAIPVGAVALKRGFPHCTLRRVHCVFACESHFA